MSVRTRCPVCDMNASQLTALEALTLGIGLGGEYGRDSTREMMCPQHRVRYTMAQLSMAQKLHGTGE